MELTFWDKIRASVGLSYTKSTQERFAAELAEDLKAQAAAVAKAQRDAKHVAEAKAAVKKMATPVVTAKAPKVEVVLKAAKARPKAVKLNTKAVDGDGDGLIQDGTIHERKAPAKKPAVKKATPKPKK